MSPPPDRCYAPPIARRTLPANPDDGWRAPDDVSNRTLPRFFFHELSSWTRSLKELRTYIGNQRIEEVIPLKLAQHLVDLPLLEELEHHPNRVHEPSLAEWHVVGVAPFASRVLTLLRRNVSADGLRCCNLTVCRLISPADLAPHTARLAELVEYLGMNEWWRQKGVPFALISSGIPVDLALDRAQN